MEEEGVAVASEVGEEKGGVWCEYGVLCWRCVNGEAAEAASGWDVGVTYGWYLCGKQRERSVGDMYSKGWW